jgi:hypothetical protein
MKNSRKSTRIKKIKTTLMSIQSLSLMMRNSTSLIKSQEINILMEED